MGEARRRGTFEERKAAAIARDKMIALHAEALEMNWRIDKAAIREKEIKEGTYKPPKRRRSGLVKTLAMAIATINHYK